jgi:hypothetical protein
VAACSEGLGRSDFIDWFSADNSSALAERLCTGYQVNGQTAWSLLRKAERFRVKIVTDLPRDEVTKMRMELVSPESVRSEIESGTKGYVLPFGARTMIRS